MNILKRTGKRMLALLLCFVLALSVPVLPAPSASAADWLSPYLDKMVSWNVVKGDGNGNYNTGNVVTRAEFVAMMNRAYGYNDMGTMPFTDVTPWDWFYEDINKAYTAGIFQGTSATTAEPYAPITREQAITLLARTMRMDEIPGEIIDFTDGRQFSSWSRGYVKAAIKAGIINGYEDGSCKPMQNVTRGEAIKMMCVGIGSLINSPGTHAPGGVFGNVTINCTNVTLKDTIITGDLYISGGISLGDVVLENVQVRGRIVVAGGGSSELGQNSVLLRGVDTGTLIVDAPTGQYVSVRTEGRTHINNGLFRSDAYLDDGCRDNYGILNVSLEGDPGDSFTLSGNLENVVNRTPDSTLLLGDAQAANVTVDEKATGSKLVLEVNASADEVNLDVGTAVEGSGDIGHLVINSDGSSTTMLPDTITIRPGLKGDISGEEMDSSEADEFSEEPRILNGYPKVANVAPTTADGINSTNKQGTIYWGLTTAAVGAVPDTDEGRDRLINPSYGAGFLLSGNYPATSSNTDFNIPERLTGLTSSGTYFVSAVLVDARGHQSPVYSERFETPDDIVPAFSTQPYMSTVETDGSYATVMANKSCDMYYALFPQGSTAPTQNDFLAYANLGDALGYGRIHMSKNKTETFPVNGKIPMGQVDPLEPLTELAEKASYDLYLWLADADGIKSSGITKLTFTTRDKTPPKFTTDMQQTTMGPTSLGVTGVIDEPGTIYWVMVEVGTGREYPVKPQGWQDEYGSEEEYMKSEHAKMQVFNGTGGDFRGSIRTTGNTNANATISGLKSETAYEFYYVAVDQATPGNFSESVQHFTVYTEDNTPPTASLSFSRIAPNTGTDTVPPQPYADADVRVEFSENILDGPSGRQPLKMYQEWKNDNSDTAKNNLMEFLRKNIKLYQVVGGNATDVSGTVLKYENVVIELNREGKLVVTFPGSANENNPRLPAGHEMGSGSTYYFEFTHDITDASMQKNPMRAPFQTPNFTTVSSLAWLDKDNAFAENACSDRGAGYNTPNANNVIDMGFTLKPESTSTCVDGLRWNMLLWFDIYCEFDLYRRPYDAANATSNDGWTYLGNSGSVIPNTSTGTQGGISLSNIITSGDHDGFLVRPNKNQQQNEMNYLDDSKTYEYAIHFTRVGNSSDRETFNDSITCEVTVLTGVRDELRNLSRSPNKDSMNAAIIARTVTDISSPSGFIIRNDFTDTSAPNFTGGMPEFSTGDRGVEVAVSLERTGTVYYVIAECQDLKPTNSAGEWLEKNSNLNPNHANAPQGSIIIPDNGNDPDRQIDKDILASPKNTQIQAPDGPGGLTGRNLIKGSIPNVGNDVSRINVNGLLPEHDYYIYLVTQSSANKLSRVFVYHFKTKDMVRPIIEATYSTNTVYLSSNLSATVHYMVLLDDETKLHDPNDIYRDLTLPFSGNVVESSYTARPNVQKVVDAMRNDEKNPQNKNQSAGSTYDLFAKQEYKDGMAQFIRGAGRTDKVIASGSIEVPGGGQDVTLDCSKMGLSPGLEYVFVAVGNSPSGSGDGFRAVNIHLQDTTPPRIESAEYLYVEDTNKISGTLILNFGEPLYYYDGKTKHKLCNHGLADTHNKASGDTSSYTSFATVIDRKSDLIDFDTISSGNCSQVSSIAFKFKKVPQAGTIAFKSHLLADETGNRVSSLTITARIENNRVVVDITPDSLDARPR